MEKTDGEWRKTHSKKTDGRFSRACCAEYASPLKISSGTFLNKEERRFTFDPARSR